MGRGGETRKPFLFFLGEGVRAWDARALAFCVVDGFGMRVNIYIYIGFYLLYFRLGAPASSGPHVASSCARRKKKMTRSAKQRATIFLIFFFSPSSHITQPSSRYRDKNQIPPRMVDSALGPCLMAFLALRYPWAGDVAFISFHPITPFIPIHSSVQRSPHKSYEPGAFNSSVQSLSHPQANAR